MEIRKATEDDILSIVSLGAQFHGESAYRNTAFDPAYFATFLRTVVTHGDYVALLAESGGTLHGALLALVSPFFFSGEIKATDIMFYVSPRGRGTPAAFRLEKAFSAWAKEKGDKMPKILGVSSGMKLDKVNAFYERMGYICIGHVFAKEL